MEWMVGQRGGRGVYERDDLLGDPGGEAIGTYTYDTGTPAPIRDSVADGVLRYRFSRSMANLELFVAGEDLLIGTYRIAGTNDRRHTYTRVILTRVRD